MFIRAFRSKCLPFAASTLDVQLDLQLDVIQSWTSTSSRFRPASNRKAPRTGLGRASFGAGGLGALPGPDP
jgi:hypothetical protein